MQLRLNLLYYNHNWWYKSWKGYSNEFSVNIAKKFHIVCAQTVSKYFLTNVEHISHIMSKRTFGQRHLLNTGSLFVKQGVYAWYTCTHSSSMSPSVACKTILL